MTRTPKIMLLALALGSVACAHKGASTYDYDDSYSGDAAAAEAAPADYGGYDGTDAEEDMEPADEPSITSQRSERKRLFGARRKDSAAREVVASPATGGAAPPAEATAAPPEDAEPAVSEDMPDDVGRHIIYSAAMAMSVFNLDDAMEAAEALPDRFGGYIASMSQGHFVLRIPSKNLRKVMNELGELGVVESRSMTAQDVTDEFYDIESRITALEKTHTQLLELLGKARNVQEALEVRRSLDQIAMELEVLKGRMRKLENMISFSTLTLNLVERGPHMPTPTSNDPFPWVDGLGVEATEWK